MKIEIWADYACPFCYIGKSTLDRAIEELGIKDEVEIVYKAFQLDPNAPKESTENTITHLSKKYRVPYSEAEKMVNNVILHGKREGLDFRFDLAQGTNTFDAHRLTKLAGKVNLSNGLNMVLYDAYFTKGINIADVTNLVKIGQSLGIESNIIDDLFKTNQYETEVKRDIEEANRKNINAVPYFLINGRTSIKGAQSLAYFIQALQDNRVL